MTLSFPFIFISYLSRAADTDDAGLLSSRVVSQWLRTLHRDYPYFGVLNTLVRYCKTRLVVRNLSTTEKCLMISSTPDIHLNRAVLFLALLSRSTVALDRDSP